MQIKVCISCAAKANEGLHNRPFDTKRSVLRMDTMEELYMMNMLMEAVVLSFTVGGIFGAILALHLKSSKQWAPKESLVYINKDDRSKIRRQ